MTIKDPHYLSLSQRVDIGVVYMRNTVGVGVSFGILGMATDDMAYSYTALTWRIVVVKWMISGTLPISRNKAIAKKEKE